jgi:uncharacterized protein (TIGR00297 family)
MVLSLGLAALGVGVTLALAGAAVAAGALTRAAGVLAAVFGSFIVVLAGFPFLALLILFVAASSLATRYGFEEKARRKVQEGTRGERGITNVLAHIVIPYLLVLAAVQLPDRLPQSTLAFLYTAAIAFGAADTFASEFGVLSGRARSILTLRPVPAGTNGGVSLLGELWAFVGAAVTAAVGAGLFALFGAPQPAIPLMVGGVLVAGFGACQVDSLLGELLENRGFLGKGSTNFFAMLSAVGIGVGILALAGAPL